MSRYYLIIGDKENWKISLKRRIWGFSEKFKGYWNKTNEGDDIAFYVTSPIKKVIGFGKITKKYTDSSELVWSDEVFFKRSIWPYKIKFEVLHVIENWEAGIPPPEGIMLNVGRKLVSQEQFSALVKDADFKWRTRLFEQIFRNSKF